MARLRKIFIRHGTYFITFRTESGLPFPATLLTKRVLEGIICKAKDLYEIEVICFKFMSNHAHILVTVTCPESVDDFIMYVKRETAHAANRLLGRRKRTIWCAGYDSPIVLDFDKLLDIIAYIYTNAAESGVSDSIDEYPGFSSWEMFLTDDYEIRRKRLSRRALPIIGTGTCPISLQEKLINELEKGALEENSFILSPYAFMKSFQIDESEEEIKELIVSRVRSREDELRALRKKTLPSRTRLMTSGIVLDYSPRKFGKRMICHSSVKELRVNFINWFKDQCEKATYIYQQSKRKLAEMVLPPGLFYPGGALSANIWSPSF